jgi:hypothetical protein
VAETWEQRGNQRSYSNIPDFSRSAKIGKTSLPVLCDAKSIPTWTEIVDGRLRKGELADDGDVAFELAAVAIDGGVRRQASIHERQRFPSVKALLAALREWHETERQAVALRLIERLISFRRTETATLDGTLEAFHGLVVELRQLGVTSIQTLMGMKLLSVLELDAPTLCAVVTGLNAEGEQAKTLSIVEVERPSGSERHHAEQCVLPKHIVKRLILREISSLTKATWTNEEAMESLRFLLAMTSIEVAEPSAVDRAAVEALMSVVRRSAIAEAEQLENVRTQLLQQVAIITDAPLGGVFLARYGDWITWVKSKDGRWQTEVPRDLEPTLLRPRWSATELEILKQRVNADNEWFMADVLTTMTESPRKIDTPGSAQVPWSPTLRLDSATRATSEERVIARGLDRLASSDDEGRFFTKFGYEGVYRVVKQLAMAEKLHVPRRGTRTDASDATGRQTGNVFPATAPGIPLANAQVCFDFQRGKCDRGATCRFSHTGIKRVVAVARVATVGSGQSTKRHLGQWGIPLGFGVPDPGSADSLLGDPALERLQSRVSPSFVRLKDLPRPVMLGGPLDGTVMKTAAGVDIYVPVLQRWMSFLRVKEDVPVIIGRLALEAGDFDMITTQMRWHGRVWRLDVHGHHRAIDLFGLRDLARNCWGRPLVFVLPGSEKGARVAPVERPSMQDLDGQDPVQAPDSDSQSDGADAPCARCRHGVMRERDIECPHCNNFARVMVCSHCILNHHRHLLQRQHPLRQ